MGFRINLNSIANVDKVGIKEALREIKDTIIQLRKPRRRPSM